MNRQSRGSRVNPRSRAARGDPVAAGPSAGNLRRTAGVPERVEGGDLMTSLRIQLRLDDETRIGSGKIRLLEEIEKTGSISAAARVVGMSYRRGWELIDQMNRGFGRPVVSGTTGALGGTEVTALGRDIVAHYRALEKKVSQAATDDLRAIEALVAPQ